MSYTDRFQRLTRQATYQRAISSRGLVAILEPYTLRTPSIPAQRRAVPTITANHAV